MCAARNDKIKKFADMAYASAQAKINSEYEIKIANMREDLGKRGLSSSSVMDREMARLHAERVMALVRANANALMEGYELYGTLDEEAAQEIIRDVTQLHGTVTTAIGGTAEWETAMRMRRTGENDLGAPARAREFAQQVDRLSTPVLNEIACEIERRRLMPKKNPNTAPSRTSTTSTAIIHAGMFKAQMNP